MSDRSALLGAIRDQVLAIARGHEREAHGGRPRPANRASIVAYFARCLGVRGELWEYAGVPLADYDARCDAQSCSHNDLSDGE